MLKAEQIPDKAVEAAAKALMKAGSYRFLELAEDDATAALRAGIAAWPGSYSLAENDSAVIRDVAAIILPLPQENTNAEA